MASLAAASLGTTLPLSSRRSAAGPPTVLSAARPYPSLLVRPLHYRRAASPALYLFARPYPTSSYSSSIRCSAALSPGLRSTLDKMVQSHKVVLFMKGTKDFPQCGFSATVVQILNSLGVPFETLDVLGNETLRQALKEYSNWPTFPQLYIDGEFFGGCDITLEAYQSGELKELLEKAMCS